MRSVVVPDNKRTDAPADDRWLRDVGVGALIRSRRKLLVDLRRSYEKAGFSKNQTLDFVMQNVLAAERIDRNIAIVQAKTTQLRRKDGNERRSGQALQVVSYPQLYKFFGNGKYIAFNPGAVNQLVLGSSTSAPDPQVPAFRRQIQRNAARQGISVGFLNDDVYHDRQGEIHCGTNELRVPRPANARLDTRSAGRVLRRSRPMFSGSVPTRHYGVKYPTRHR